jgi:hypothetical protein
VFESSTRVFLYISVLNPNPSVFVNQNNKIILIFLLGFTLRIIYSCCECENNIQRYSINNIIIQNIDNSGIYTKPAGDTLYRNAVAFEITLNNNEFSYSTYESYGTTGFSTIFACDCNTYFQVLNKIDSITIITENNINFEYPAQTDITDLFVAFSPLQQNEFTSIYRPINEVIEQLNESTQFNDNFLKFQCFLTIPVDYNEISFQFNIYLSDKTLVSKNTSIIYLK